MIASASLARAVARETARAPVGQWIGLALTLGKVRVVGLVAFTALVDSLLQAP